VILEGCRFDHPDEQAPRLARRAGMVQGWMLVPLDAPCMDASWGRSRRRRRVKLLLQFAAMHIEFDPAKNQANIRKRGLAFETVADFDFDTAVVVQDTRKDYPEERYVAVGFLAHRLHVLCFTPVIGGIRVISFRKANLREVKSHAQIHTPDQ
jgi:hypothetical protein